MKLSSGHRRRRRSWYDTQLQTIYIIVQLQNYISCNFKTISTMKSAAVIAATLATRPVPNRIGEYRAQRGKLGWPAGPKSLSLNKLMPERWPEVPVTWTLPLAATGGQTRFLVGSDPFPLSFGWVCNWWALGILLVGFAVAANKYPSPIL